jgi:hypothetical protein
VPKGLKVMSKGSELRNSALSKEQWLDILLWKSECTKIIKGNASGSLVLRNPLVPIPNPSQCPSSPGVREPISAVIPINPLINKKEQCYKRQMLVIFIVRQKMDKIVIRRELPWLVVQDSCIEVQLFAVRW